MLSAKPRNPYSTRSTPVYVGGYTVGFAGTASTTNVSLTSLTGGIASAPSENDIVIVAYSASSNFSGTPTVSGYTVIAQLLQLNAKYSKLHVSYKKMTATPDTSITLSGSSDFFNCTAAVYVFRGQDLTTPFDATATTDTGISSGLVDPPAIFVPNAGGLIICAGSVCSITTGGAMGASYLSNFITETRDQPVANDCSVGIGSIVSNGGSYNPGAWTFANDTANSSWCAVTMALRGA